MIDPQKCTNFARNSEELEEFLIFCVCVAGHNANSTAKAVEKFKNRLFNYYGDKASSSFFENIYYYVGTWVKPTLPKLLSESGIGCCISRTRTLYELSGVLHDKLLYLHSCRVEDLERIYGLGSKTARYYLLHTRPNQRLAALDTHILKFLRANGIDAPRSTPAKGSKRYYMLEQEFLRLSDEIGIAPAELDLKLWNYYSKNGNNYDKQRRDPISGKRFIISGSSIISVE